MEIVDIIMGTYNGERYIKEQIDSIIKNTWKNWRIWVCDDGSTDKTEEIVKRYEEEYPDKIFWKPNEKNKGAAINFLDSVGLYVNYAPCRMFKDGKGPELKTLSADVAICY